METSLKELIIWMLKKIVRFWWWITGRWSSETMDVNLFQNTQALTTQPVDLPTTLGMTFLSLPANTAAVLNSNRGEKVLLHKGGMLELKRDLYSVQFVDMRKRTMRLPDVQAPASDSWLVHFTGIAITGQIKDPLTAAGIDDSFQMLARQCSSEMANYISSRPYETMVRTPLGTALSVEEISNQILTGLQNNPDLSFFEFSGFKMLTPAGDRRQIDEMQDEIIRRLKERQSLVGDTKRVDLEMSLVKAQSELNITKTQLELLQFREEAKISEARAKLEVYLDEMMSVIQARAISLRQLGEQPQMRQEILLRWMEFYSEIFTQLAQALGQVYPGLQPSSDSREIVEKLEQAFDVLARTRFMDGTLPPIPEPESDPKKPKLFSSGD